MINQYLEGQIPALASGKNEFDAELEETAANAITGYTEALDHLQFNVALQNIWKLISRTNKYIDETTPWILAREEKTAELSNVLAHLVESLRVAGTLLLHFLVETLEQIAEQLGLKLETDMSWDKLAYGNFPEGRKVVKKGQPIFPRLDVEEETLAIQESMTPPTEEADETTPWNPEMTELSSVKKEEVNFEHFDAVELKVAEVMDCARVENADKLLKFRLDAGDEGGDRQI